MYMDNIRVFAKKENKEETFIETIRYSRDIGMEFGIKNCTMLMMV